MANVLTKMCGVVQRISEVLNLNYLNISYGKTRILQLGRSIRLEDFGRENITVERKS